MSRSTTSPDTESFRRAMSLVPTAVTVVATLDAGAPAGATANAVVALSLEPLLMLASLHRESRTLAAISRTSRFSINVLEAGQEEIARAFASKDPVERKWAGVGFSERDGAPWIDGALVNVGCSLRESFDGGDHVIVIGEVLSLECGDGLPLLFHRGAYPSVGLE
jgi:flavin reductase